MKHIFSAFLVLLSLVAYGQAPTPVCGDSAVIAYADAINCNTTCVQLHAIVKGQTPINSGISRDDYYSAVIPIGFNFNFYGTTYGKCLISPNGMITFDTTKRGAWTDWRIPAVLGSCTTARNSICGAWCDMDITKGPGGTITYATVGTSPNRRFIAEWCNVPMYSCTTQRTTCQIVIYETCNLIDVFVNNKQVCTGHNGGYAIIGVQNANGTANTAATGRNYPATYTCTNEAYRFTPNGGYTAYTVGNIGFRPVPLASSTVRWYLGSSQVGTGLDYSCATIGQTYRVEVAGCNGVITSASVKPTFAPTGTLQTVPVCVGSTASYSLGGLPAGGGWTSGNAAIATLNSSNSTVTGVSAGTTTYTYTAPNGCTRSIQINVTDCCSDTCAWIVSGNNIHNGKNIFGTLSNDDVRIFTNNTQRSVLKANGYMGIKQLSPTTTLNVNCVPPAAVPSGLRFENLPQGYGNALVVDAQGYVYITQSTLYKQSYSDMQEQIEKLQAQMAELQALLQGGNTPLHDGSSLLVTPNPSNGQMSATYKIAGTFRNAVIKITDVNGRLITTRQVNNNTGSVDIDLQNSTASGNVIVTLLVDGSIVAQQKEVLVK